MRRFYKKNNRNSHTKERMRVEDPIKLYDGPPKEYQEPPKTEKNLINKIWFENQNLKKINDFNLNGHILGIEGIENEKKKL